MTNINKELVQEESTFPPTIGNFLQNISLQIEDHDRDHIPQISIHEELTTPDSLLELSPDSSPA